MKYLLFTVSMLFLMSGCEKEFQSPEEQLMNAINSKFNTSSQNSTFFVLKNEKVCRNIECSRTKYELQGSAFAIYSREELFMRGIGIFVEVVKWDEKPIVCVIDMRTRHRKI